MAESGNYPVRILCRVMRVSRSCYYSWAARLEARKAPCANAERVRECFERNSRRYGSRRIAAELGMGRYRVRRLMREQKLVAIRPRSFIPKTTDSGHKAAVSPNLLEKGGNQPQSWGEVLVGDITYLRLIGGAFCYLATFQDKLTRRIVGWAVSASMTRHLVTGALRVGLRRGLVRQGAIVHSDRGSQYASRDYRELLEMHGLRQSMSGKGNCYDNAQAESFFSRFKSELVEDGAFESVEQAISEAFSYIEGYYNPKRLHSGILYLTPIEFENLLRFDNWELINELKSLPVKQRRALLASNPSRNSRQETHQQMSVGGASPKAVPPSEPLQKVDRFPYA
ncbi:MAG: IS3 family transposase [Pyrinomonadaceae bacterium]